jgi:hypothetical protein
MLGRVSSRHDCLECKSNVTCDLRKFTSISSPKISPVQISPSSRKSVENVSRTERNNGISVILILYPLLNQHGKKLPALLPVVDARRNRFSKLKYPLHPPTSNLIFTSPPNSCRRPSARKYQSMECQNIKPPHDPS